MSVSSLHVTTLGLGTTIHGTYPKTEINLILSGNLSSMQFPAVYDLVIALNRVYDFAEKATMVTTITLHNGMYCCQANLLEWYKQH